MRTCTCTREIKRKEKGKKVEKERRGENVQYRDNAFCPSFFPENDRKLEITVREWKQGDCA